MLDILFVIIFYILFFYGIYKLINIAIKAHEKKIEDFNNSNFSKNANVNYYEMKNNIGSQGEYKLYKYLNYNITDKYIINNIYLEKTPYQTTEIEYMKNNYVLNDIHLVKDIIELSEDTLTQERIERIYGMLKVKTGKSKEYKQEHINRINS